jgi:Fe-Mn family superoxide dismutase
MKLFFNKFVKNITLVLLICKMDKRTFIKTGLIGLAAFFTSSFSVKAKSLLYPLKTRKDKDGFAQPALPYAFDALEPFIDAETMKIHYLKHHATYTQKFNEIAKQMGITNKPAREILKEVSKYPEVVRNNGGGYLNHILFWNMLSPDGGGMPEGTLREAIISSFGSIDNFKNKFETVARSVFGSGWAWLILSEGKLRITATQDQDSPIMDISKDKGFPILCLDVWEHAYYMKYQNNRNDYINAFWNIVNWNFASKRYNFALSKQIS